MTQARQVPRGRLLVFEGLDGAGKSTASRLAADALGAAWLPTPPLELREARAVFDAAAAVAPDAAQLFYAAAVAMASARALELMAAGRDVVMDRYWLSTWTWCIDRGSSLELVEVERSLARADVTIFLDASVAVRRARLTARGPTEQDRRTLDPARAHALRQRLLAGLERPIAGRALLLDVDALEGAEVVRASLAHLEASTAQRGRWGR